MIIGGGPQEEKKIEKRKTILHFLSLLVYASKVGAEKSINAACINFPEKGENGCKESIFG